MNAPIAAIAGYFPELPDRRPRSTGGPVPDRTIKSAGVLSSYVPTYTRRAQCTRCGGDGHDRRTCRLEFDGRRSRRWAP